LEVSAGSARCPLLEPEVEAEARLRASLQASCGDPVESLDEVDVAVEVVEPLRLDGVLALPCRADRHRRSMSFEPAVEVGQLDVVSDDLGIEAGNPRFNLAARSAARRPVERIPRHFACTGS
jgi:hypothetical protein